MNSSEPWACYKNGILKAPRDLKKLDPRLEGETSNGFVRRQMEKRLAAG
jgi:hypothetical protein